MTQIRVCDRCGKNLYIEDSDNLEPVCDLIPPENEHLQEAIICELCASYHVVDKA